MAERLKDAVVLLTGAGGGIGTALTEALLVAGVAEIVSAGRDHPPAHARVRQETVDVTDLSQVKALAQRYAGRVTDLAGPELTPAERAQAILQAIESGAEDAYPGPAAAAYDLYLADPKAAERRMAARLP